MLAAQSPLSGHHPIQVPKTSRRPLQPKNQSITTTNTTDVKPKPHPEEWVEISWLDDSNKENVPPFYSTPVKEQYSPIESFDASLADELSAIREKLERLKIDKEKTAKLLRERVLTLDLQMKDILNRGEAQTQLEIEVDRLYRLKEIRLACLRVSSVRSLREKEEERKMKQDQLKAHVKTEARDDQRCEGPSRSPNPYN
ncbi:hypothetical protein CDL12_05912 [Handroanthus impetiginosus]|uniref:Uncharacterized protein n=1 Tax=Handroanthus impetiginosus TaxID=429701 RepID=A0A2G9HV20_9LAMI|nr:hypothetical protein CDL12_05912 [Handroanthus impetiginosus]